MTLALAAGRRDEALNEAKQLGLQIVGAEPDFALTVCYILFDTRMDMMEAHASPLDSNIPPEMRVVRIDTIPEELFMLIRVVALIRGMLISLDTDVHARMIWRPYALAALETRTNATPNALLGARAGGVHQRGQGAQRQRRRRRKGGDSGNHRRRSAVDVRQDESPRDVHEGARSTASDRKAMMPFASSGLTSLEAIAAADHRGESTKLDSAFRRFNGEQRKRCLALAREEHKAAVKRLDAEFRKEQAKAAEEAKAREAEKKAEEERLEKQALKAQKSSKDTAGLSISMMTKSIRWSIRAKRYVAARKAAAQAEKEQAAIKKKERAEKEAKAKAEADAKAKAKAKAEADAKAKAEADAKAKAKAEADAKAKAEADAKAKAEADAKAKAKAEADAKAKAEADSKAKAEADAKAKAKAEADAKAEAEGGRQGKSQG